ncbi:decaprenylcistransferase [Blastocystis sp. subtype 4]|uniref:decaprenylcistransferase n=1 Tax=Blastocystis sp. subtype 4 TaxID=944170 RepID=UPI000711B785|nr:decaprenylcistransferase [Blastocystis sp. subtype 4]KNB45016.1 decaprenylcistransferase [Blastocystis sp. subtype 4]|eukprot:XP_014528459.1 decaprenylcistransferase [Blastocystis sp. subtype 4]
MDGNRRWAKKHGLDVIEGHKKGSEVFRESVKWCCELGIKEYTVYAFSCENWNRTEREVSDLMSLFALYTDEVIKTMKNDKESIYNQVRLRFIGRHILDDLSLVNLHSQAIKMEKLEKESKNNSLLLVNWDIAQSCMKIVQNTRMQCLLDETPSISTVEEMANQIAANLSTGDSPVDVVIRTGGEHRISNFLLWQISYAEIFVVDSFWPDFTCVELRKALMEIARRNRRFGK